MKFDKNDDSKDDDSKDDDSKDDDSDDDDTNLDTKDTDNFDVTTTLASTMTTGFLEMQFTSDVSDGPPGLSKKLSQHNMGILAGDKSHRKIDIRYENLGLKVISNGKVVRSVSNHLKNVYPTPFFLLQEKKSIDQKHRYFKVPLGS